MAEHTIVKYKGEIYEARVLEKKQMALQEGVELPYDLRWDKDNAFTIDITDFVSERFLEVLAVHPEFTVLTVNLDDQEIKEVEGQTEEERQEALAEAEAKRQADIDAAEQEKADAEAKAAADAKAKSGTAKTNSQK